MNVNLNAGRHRFGSRVPGPWGWGLVQELGNWKSFPNQKVSKVLFKKSLISRSPFWAFATYAVAATADVANYVVSDVIRHLTISHLSGTVRVGLLGIAAPFRLPKGGQ